MTKHPKRPRDPAQLAKLTHYQPVMPVAAQLDMNRSTRNAG